ncbi:MAG: heavy metal-responsive transcriptional regulator [Acidimicrobiales bacterium]
MLIGQLADALGIPTRTVRFYERKGLLPDPERADNGYRVYDDATLNRLRFIRTAQAAGLTLAEIASVIHVRDDGTVPCSHVDALLETKLAEVRERRRQLATLESDLSELLERSRHLDPANCTAGEICHIFTPSDQP